MTGRFEGSKTCRVRTGFGRHWPSAHHSETAAAAHFGFGATDTKTLGLLQRSGPADTQGTVRDHRDGASVSDRHR